VACRLHAVLYELIPGGVAKRISAAQAGQLPERMTPSGAAEAARCELATALLDDLRRTGAQMRDAKNKLTVAVRASATTLTQVFGAGPIIAATAIGEARDVSRFASRDHFAAYNGTAPIEVSSGRRTIYRLSRRGNRRLNHAVHMAAVTQVSHRHSPGRACYERKLAEGQTPKQALRSLKRRLSDVIFARRQTGTRPARSGPAIKSPGGHMGNDSVASAAGSHPRHRLFGQATPGPTSTLRPAAAARGKKTPRTHYAESATNPLTQTGIDMAPALASRHDRLCRGRTG
jgi:transposase